MTTTKTEFSVIVRPAEGMSRMWELEIIGVGCTQARKPSEADEMIRDYIDATGLCPYDKINLDITWKLADDVDAEIADARAATANAAKTQEEAAKKSRSVAATLKSNGFNGRDIASILGISAQRVSQLLSPK